MDELAELAARGLVETCRTPQARLCELAAWGYAENGAQVVKLRPLDRSDAATTDGGESVIVPFPTRIRTEAERSHG